MSTENIYKGISHVIHISTGEQGITCEHCKSSSGLEDFAKSINHYIEMHDYKLLHVGTETIYDYESKPFPMTIAVIGK